MPPTIVSRQSHEPQWRTIDHWPAGGIPRPWLTWLTDSGSLTRRLVAASGGDFRVQVLGQRIDQPRFSERRALDLRVREWALIREVVLYGCGQPWVFARSILPLTTLTGRLRRFRHLDNRPLGELLFRYHSMTRDALEIACVSGHLLPPASQEIGDDLWGRRSIFRVDGKPLLVGEIFLPAFKP